MLPSGNVLFALHASVCFVQPVIFRLAERLHHRREKSNWLAVTEAQNSIVRILTNGESAFKFCTFQDNNYCLKRSVDEFIVMNHILSLAYDKLEEKTDNKIQLVSTTKVSSQFRKAHKAIRQRTNKQQKQVDRVMKTLEVYGVTSLQDINMRISHEYNGNEDICILQNTDVFNFYEKRNNKEGFVTIFRKTYPLYLKSGTIASLAAVAIEVIGFIQKCLKEEKESASINTVDTTVQEFSNYLLGHRRQKLEMDQFTLSGRLFKSAATAIYSLASDYFHQNYTNIWDEALIEFDLNSKDLIQSFEINFQNICKQQV